MWKKKLGPRKMTCSDMHDSLGCREVQTGSKAASGKSKQERMSLPWDSGKWE